MVKDRDPNAHKLHQIASSDASSYEELPKTKRAFDPLKNRQNHRTHICQTVWEGCHGSSLGGMLWIYCLSRSITLEASHLVFVFIQLRTGKDH